MLKRILTVFLFTAILGIVIAQRFFSIESPLPTHITNISGESEYSLDEPLKRGQRIHTGDEYLALTIGEDIHIYLAPRTDLELTRNYKNEIELRFTKGRLVIATESETPINVNTNYTSSLVYQDTASFINYDFLETIQIIPLTGAIQTTLKSTNESFLTPTPVSIHETNPVTVDDLEVNLEAGDSAEFYEWTGVLSDK